MKVPPECPEKLPNHKSFGECHAQLSVPKERHLLIPESMSVDATINSISQTQ